MLSENYKKSGLTYKEKGKRISLRLDPGESAEAYEIEEYFEELFNGQATRPQTADGLYAGRLPNGETCVIVVELEGTSTNFGEATKQVESTIEILCRTSRNPALTDDGERHHQNATEVYPLSSDHRVMGIVVGSKAGRGYTPKVKTKSGKRFVISRVRSRKQTHQYSLQSLIDEIEKNAGGK